MPAYKVEIQEVVERSGIVTAASVEEVEGVLEDLGYALFKEDAQVTEREVVSVAELTPADLGVDVTDATFVLETRDGVGAIPVGATLVWNKPSRKLEQLGTHYLGGTSVFNQVHPVTAALVEESRRRLVESGHRGGWRLDGVAARTIWLTPVEDTSEELEERFGYPAGSLNGA